ncbi:MAG: hypothetical protein ACUVQF_07590 [Fervidobacterium sp.]|uniref:hypothetical protein n=1 Tax=Fervidobacterium sp. TaxID=1871331 RepID=UPI004049127B
MKFLDGINVTYVKKDEKSTLSKILNELSKYKTKLAFKPLNNELYGEFRIEFYAPIEGFPTIKLTGLIVTDEPIEWLMTKDDQSAMAIEKILHVVDTEILELDTARPIPVVILEQSKVYAVVNEELTKDFTINQLVNSALERLFEVYFDKKFIPDEYEIQIHSELTDYFV